MEVLLQFDYISLRNPRVSYSIYRESKGDSHSSSLLLIRLDEALPVVLPPTDGGSIAADSLTAIEFHSEEEPFIDRIDSYQRKTGLTETFQRGIGQLNGIPVAVGVTDFHFMG